VNSVPLKLRAFAALLLACSPFAHAQPPQPLAVLPPNNFQFAGAWSCEGKMGGGRLHKSNYTASLILDGKWLELAEQDLEPATGYQAKYLIGYDSQQKRLVEFDANNFGAAVYASTAGWQNNALTMTSTANPSSASYAADRFTYTVAGPDDFTVDWQIRKTSQSEWATSDHLACKRRLPGALT
jgi:hypothetical protein